MLHHQVAFLTDVFGKVVQLQFRTFDDTYAAAGAIISPDGFHGSGEQQCGGGCAWMMLIILIWKDIASRPEIGIRRVF